MENTFQNMNTEYMNKNFPEHSVIQATMKIIRKRNIGSAISCMIVMIAGIVGFFWSCSILKELMADGRNEDLKSVGIVILVVLSLIIISFMLLTIVCMKRVLAGRKTWIAKIAKTSHLSEREIELFDQQAMQSDCLILEWSKAFLDRAIQSSGKLLKDGLLTRDYLYVGDISQSVLRIEDLRVVCFVGDDFAIGFIAENGVGVWSHCQPKIGQEIMRILCERNDKIDTLDHDALSREGFIKMARHFQK